MLQENEKGKRKMLNIGGMKQAHFMPHGHMAQSFLTVHH
jgi:hypothetical protein